MLYYLNIWNEFILFWFINDFFLLLFKYLRHQYKYSKNNHLQQIDYFGFPKLNNQKFFTINFENSKILKYNGTESKELD
jgi:hypothetical protein